MGESDMLSRAAQVLRTALFRAYLRRFVLLWIAGKIANAVTAVLIDLPPLAFRPGTELAICAVELTVLTIFIRRVNEDTLLGNLGLSLPQVLAPFAALHFALSAVLALVT